MTSESTDPVLPRAPSRDSALDATRTVAIWLMIICHVARLIPKKFRPSLFDSALRIEPLCQALFMAMVGVSLVYSMRIAAARGAPSWGKRQIRRALELYGIGFLFFFLQYGWQWPWLFIGHGILLAIASAILFLVPLVRRDPGLPAALALTLGLTGAFYGCDLLSWQIPFLITGHGSFLPHVVLAAFGVFAAYLLLDAGPRVRGLVVSFLHLPWRELFWYPFGRVKFIVLLHGSGNGLEQVWSLLTEDEQALRRHRFYHYRAFLAPLLMSLCAGIYLFFRLWGTWADRLRPLWIVGRHSLDVYILHLVLVAGVTVVSGRPRPFRDGLSVTLCFLLITLVCYGYAYWKERRRGQ
jgi:hypothetical protein